MTLTLRFLLESVGNGDGAVAEILAVHGIDSSVGGIEAGKVDECETFTVSRVRITHYLWGLENYTESRKRIIEEFLIDFRIQIADEYIGSNIQVLLMSGRLIDSDGLAVEFNHVHDANCVFCVFLAEKLDESVTLVIRRNAVLGHVYINDRPGLDKQLSQ